MSIYLYGDSLVKKITQVGKGNAGFPNVKFAPYETLLRTDADTQGDLDDLPTFPVIGVWRRSLTLAPSAPHQDIYQGIYRSSDGSPNSEVYQMKRRKIDLVFEINVMAISQKMALGLMEELVFFFLDFPTLPLHLERPYPFVINDAKIQVTGIEENIETSDFVDSGSLYRETIELTVDEAYIWNTIRMAPLVGNIPVSFKAYPDLP